MKYFTRQYLIQFIIFIFSLAGLQNVKAMDATFDTVTNILVIPALQIENNLHNVVLQLGGDGCLILISDAPASVTFSGARYNPTTFTATLQSVAVDKKLFRATIQFENGCFRVTSVSEVDSGEILRYADAEVTGQVVSGDFNGDSFIDLVFTIRTLPAHVSGGNNDMFRVIYGDGIGGFNNTVDISRLGSSDSTKRGHQLIAGNFDGDAVSDFAISTGQILQVFSGKVNNTPQALFNTIETPGAPLYSFDVDGNGFNDFVSIVFGGSVRSFFNLYRNSGSGSFSSIEFIGSIDDPEITAQNIGSPLNFTVGDFDGDAVHDILAIVLTGSGNDTHLAFALFAGNGNGGFKNPAAIHLISDDLFLGEFAFEEASKEIAFGDFDGDGDNDLVMTSTTSFLQVFLNNGAGQFTAAQRVQVGNKPIHARVADFNNDGINDLVSVNANSKTVVISLGNGDGTFVDVSNNSDRVISIQLDGDVDLFDMDVVDLNADGFLDIVIAEDGTNPPNTGRGSIQTMLAPGRL